MTTTERFLCGVAAGFIVGCIAKALAKNAAHCESLWYAYEDLRSDLFRCLDTKADKPEAPCAPSPSPSP